ncbi:olfactory receptor-like protein OLF3 [Podarcis raffonei]|uniref:olfactory receptor-like protein OLF3 n=1 Tax=Podarcis raffonei TaxID=65483 RepID=UPI0023294A55|nr:olfactory receptor-like protein OLF3 [Podarcis raffonei]
MMGQYNQTNVKEFVFMGFSRDRNLNLCLFVVFLSMYLVTLTGNTLIIVAIRIDPRLSTPMYFFLSNLSFLDICYTTSVVPQLLLHSLTSHKVISFSRCMAQLYISLSLGGIEFILLAAMAYDRYVAVCYPLHYMTIMSRRVYIQMAMASWMGGFLNALVQTVFTMHLQFCSFNTINHFACELLAVIKVACSNTFVNEIVIIVAGVIVLLIPCGVVLLSYVYIIRAILRIRSSEGRQRAFSTCTSHLTVVTLCYGTAIFAYMSPKANTSPNQDKMVSIFYAVVTPMLNPIIYSLRNKEVKGALSKAVRKSITT